MMKRAILFLLLISMPLLCRGSIPKPQPLAEAFADFQKAYPSRSEELIAAIRERIAEKKEKKVQERFEHLVGYSDNLRADILEAQHAFADSKDPALLPFTLHKICTDLVGFRRSLDALIIEASAAKTFPVDDAMLAKIRKIWEDEYHFSWRFSLEFAPRRHP
jgi:hypothetical protein